MIRDVGIVEKSADILILNAFLDTGNQDVDDVVAYLLQHGLIAVKLVMLGGEHDGVDAQRAVVFTVFYRHLAFGVRTQISHLATLFTDGGQFDEQTVGQVERKGHVVFRLVGGVAEHHALIAGSLVFKHRTFNPLVDVGALFMNGREHTAGIGLEHIFALGVADTGDDLTCNALQIHVGIRFDLAGQDDLSGGHHRLAGDFGIGIKGQQLIQDGVADLIGHFVGMSFRHTFRGKEILFHTILAFFHVVASSQICPHGFWVISLRGIMTKSRSCMRGCGNVSSGVSIRTSS